MSLESSPSRESKEVKRERLREWRRNNPEKYKAANRRNYESRRSSPELLLRRADYLAKWREKNPDYERKYYEKRMEKLKSDPDKLAAFVAKRKQRSKEHRESIKQAISLAHSIILTDRKKSLTMTKQQIYAKRNVERKNGVPEHLLTPLPPKENSDVNLTNHQTNDERFANDSQPIPTDTRSVSPLSSNELNGPYIDVWSRRAEAARRICAEEGIQAQSVREVIVEINGVRFIYIKE